MKRVTVAALALGVGLAWFLLQGPGTSRLEPNGSPGDARTQGAAAVRPPALAAGRASTLRTPPGTDDRPPEHGTSGILGIVRRGTMPAPAKVDLRWLVSNREYERGQRGGGSAVLRELTVRTPGAPTRTATAGEDGRVTFDEVPAGVWELAATAIDGARGVARVQVISEGARVDVDVGLFAATETLNGRVLFEDGRPFTGAVLIAPHPEMRFDEIYLPEASGTPVTLTEEGRFHAVALPRGRAVVTALATGSLRVAGMVIPIPYEGEYVLRVPVPGSIVGRVVDDADGSGIAGAEVLGTGLAGDRLALVTAGTVTDAGGGFALALPGSGTLFVRAQGYAGVTRPYADSKLEVRLQKPARLEGRITSAAKSEGVAGVEVHVRPSRERELAFPPEAATSDASGRYAFDGLEPGEAFVLASGRGWMTRGVADVGTDGFNPFFVRLEPGKTATLDLVVEAGAAILGRVLDPQGRSVAGAMVRARRLTLDMRSMLSRFEGQGEPRATSADGAFRFDALVPGSTYRLSAGAPGYTSVFVDAATPQDDSATSVELHLGAGHALVVTVVDDERGVPIPGASVTCEVSRGDMTATDQWVAGSDGRVSISPVGDAGVHVSAWADGYRPGARLDVAASLREAEVRLTPGLDIAGRVLAPDGTPASGVRVKCIPPESEVTTRGDGSFRVRGLAQGPHQVQAVASYQRPLAAATTAEAGRADVLLTLSAPPEGEASRTLVVQVVDAQGAPVPVANVDFSWRSDVGLRSTRREAADGAARFADLSDRGEGTIRVSGARSRDGAVLALGPATVEHVAATATEIVVTLPVGLSISGRVLGPNGLGVAGIPVHALTEASMRRWAGWRLDHIPSGAAATSRTASDGSFRLDGLADATYALAFDVPPDLVRPEPVRAGTGRTNVEITLRSAVIATVRVVDPDGAPMRGAHVGLYPVQAPGSAPLLSMWTLESGTVRFTSLDSVATYRLAVQVPTARADLVAPPPVEPWSPRDDVVTLRRGGAVRGVVLDTEGKPVSGSRVWWTQGDSTNGPGLVQAGEDGTFEIPHLPSGSIRLRADLMEGTPMGASPAAPTWIEASVGGERVTLTIDLGLALDIAVENWPEESPLKRPLVQARLLRDGAPPGADTAIARMGPTGRTRFRGLRAEHRYTLWVGPVGDSSVLQRGLVPGREVGVRLVPGGSILVRLEGVPSGATWTGVMAEADGITVDGKKQEDGRYRISGLPEGRWTVRAFAGGDNAPRVSARSEASTGAEVTLTLQPGPSPR